MSQQEQMLFVGMVGAQAADGITTSQNVHSGGREYNPLLGSEPNDEEIALFKVAAVGLFRLLGEIWPEHRDMFYTVGIISGGIGTGVNLARK